MGELQARHFDTYNGDPWSEHQAAHNADMESFGPSVAVVARGEKPVQAIDSPAGAVRGDIPLSQEGVGK